MFANIIVVALIVAYSAFVIRREIKNHNNPAASGCCGCSGGCGGGCSGCSAGCGSAKVHQVRKGRK